MVKWDQVLVPVMGVTMEDIITIIIITMVAVATIIMVEVEWAHLVGPCTAMARVWAAFVIPVMPVDWLALDKMASSIIITMEVLMMAATDSNMPTLA